MKRFPLIILITLMFIFSGFASAPQPKPADSAALDSVLKKMDSLAANFHGAQANFEWDIYQKVIDEIDDVETGTIYYRRHGKEVEMMAEVKRSGSSLASLAPEEKYVLFSGGKLRLYSRKIDQVQEFDLGKNHSDYDSYIVLGFGGSGQELVKTFDVTYGGAETIDGVSTSKLQLVPKSEKIRGTYNQIFLWIDDRGISVQQKFLSPQGDYKLAKYSSIKLTDKISEEVFKLKTTNKTQVVTPRG